MQNLTQFYENTLMPAWSDDCRKKGKPVDFFWQFDIPAKPDELWTYLSDTARINRELALSKQKEREVDGKREVTTTALGMTQQWIEEPWSWVTGKTLTVTRNYIKGLAKVCRVGFHVEPMANPNHSIVTVYFGWIPSNRVTKALIQVGMLTVKIKYRKILLKVAQHLSAVNEQTKKFEALDKKPKMLRDSAKKRLERLKLELLEKEMPAAAVQKLCAFIEKADELEVHRLRVVSLAQRWSIPQKDLLLTCLNGVRIGLLKMSWDVICPHCRGVRYAASTLGDIPTHVKCDVCDVDSLTDQVDSIEVTFRVHPSVRDTQEILYCSAEPARRDHIKVQQMVKPGATLKIAVALKTGLHRLRIVGQPGPSHFTVDAAADHSDLTVRWTGTGSEVSKNVVNGNAKLTLHNDSTAAQFFVIEEMWWQTRALLPREVFALKEFRDLAADEYLRTDVRLALGEQTILFTDIVGSTKFYQSEGDAKAFREVKKHFDEIFRSVKRHNGEIVKTIGDAVMAVFHHPEEGLAAAVAIQLLFQQGRTNSPLRLRISIHTGPVIAVTLNRGIDYFGGTVNMAAKLQACADGGEIALSEETYRFYVSEKIGEGQYPLTKKRLPFSLKNADVDAFVLQIKDLDSDDKAS